MSRFPAAPPFVSKPESAVVNQWAKLGAVWVSAEPALDQAAIDAGTGPRYGRFTYREALVAASLLGARLPRSAEIDTIRDTGVMLPCFTQPDVDMIKEAGIAAPNWKDPEAVAFYKRAIQDLLSARMASAEWCATHDAKVEAAKQAKGFDGSRPLMNAGKHYLDGAPKGRAWLKGWWDGKVYIQHGPWSATDVGPHSDIGSRDYGTTTMLIRETDPTAA